MSAPDPPVGTSGPARIPCGESARLGRAEVEMRAVDGGGVTERTDRVAVEEPLEIRVAAGGDRRTLAVTMRTPGEDHELAAGFLYGEGLIRDRNLIAGIECFSEEVKAPEWAGEGESGLTRDVVEVELAARRLPMLRSLERHFFTGSACGVCGRASLDELLVAGCEPAGPGPVFAAETIRSLPGSLREAQQVFEVTGGLHAAALFDAHGGRVAVREDVGRHNALDKLVGRAVLAGDLEDGASLDRHAVLVSGRASFELLQKCVAAGVPVLCAVSAPSSLAVELARRFQVTLIGFLRGERFNVYSAPERIRTAAEPGRF